MSVRKIHEYVMAVNALILLEVLFVIAHLDYFLVLVALPVWVGLFGSIKVEKLKLCQVVFRY